MAFSAMGRSAQAAAGDSDNPKWCRTCHAEARFSAPLYERSAHVAQSCRDCHTGYQFDPHEAVEEPKGATFDALKKRGFVQADAQAACTDCHDSPSPVPGSFPHGKQKDGTRAGLPYCLDCHGDAHAIALAKQQDPAARRQAMNARCEKCHEDAKAMRTAHVRPEVVAAYRRTMHAVKLDLGSPDAPGCADCHPAHPAKDAAQAQQRAAGPCVQCHDGARPGFAKLAGHLPITRQDRPVSFYTQQFFGWLTFLTILGLALHVLLDITSVFRRRKDPPAHGHKPASTAALGPASGGRVAPDGTVLRFDIHQRIAHGMMALSFTLLVLTGWPLSSHGIGASRVLVAAFGGLSSLGLVHRAAAIGLIAVALYHLGYMAVHLARRRLRATMLPGPQDLRDLGHNIAWFLGFRKERPAFGRFSYFEKFDYWAVFWGVVIMVGSGAVRWFPTQVMRWAPPWLYEVSNLAHTDEALLAALAIFVWHFYNVHLRPAVFPMSHVFLTGRMTAAEHAEDHAAEHAAWLAAAQTAEKPEAVPVERGPS
jgi:predicted CXXCH cytochrome family protein